MKLFASTVTGVVAGLLVACSKPGPEVASAQAGDIGVSDAFAFAPVTQASGAVYFRLRNTGSIPDTLAELSTPLSSRISVHAMLGSTGGPMMMRVANMQVPANGEVVLKPGGTHVMLEDLTSLPKAGDHIAMTLTFRRAGAITLAVPVRAYTQ